MEMTKEEKWKNWWSYNWWIPALCLAAAVLLGVMSWEAAQRKANQPDCQIAYIGSTALPDETVKAVEAQLAPLIGDLDGNGKAIVQIRQYVIDLEGEHVAQNDPNQQTALVAHLSMNPYFLFLLEDPAAFQERFALMTLADGRFAAEASDSTEPLWYAWSDCPALAALPLGDYAINLGGEDLYTGSSQEVLAELSIARGLPVETTPEIQAGFQAAWQRLVEGAEQ